MKKLFVTEMAPNGTRDLVVVENGTCSLEYIAEAIFGLNFKSEDMIIIDDMALWEISFHKALQNIAVSPVNDGEETVNSLMAALK
jgi:hypothetical protein